MNPRDSFRQTSPYGYRQLLVHRCGGQAWWLNAPAKTANVAPYADHLNVGSVLSNPVEKPVTGEDAVPFDPIAGDQVATALKAGFQEVEER